MNYAVVHSSAKFNGLKIMKLPHEMVRELCEKCGLTQKQVALLVDASQSTINRMVTKEQEPHYCLGRRIEQLYLEKFSDPETDKAVA